MLVKQINLIQNALHHHHYINSSMDTRSASKLMSQKSMWHLRQSCPTRDNWWQRTHVWTVFSKEGRREMNTYCWFVGRKVQCFRTLVNKCASWFFSYTTSDDRREDKGVMMTGTMMKITIILSDITWCNLSIDKNPNTNVDLFIDN